MRRSKKGLGVLEGRADNRVLIDSARELAQRNQTGIKVLDIMERVV